MITIEIILYSASCGWIIFFIDSTNEVIPAYKTIEAPKADYDKDVLSIFKAALEHEKEVTRRIRELFDAAHEIKFYEVYTLLQKFIDEQIEEEATFDNIIAKLERTENSNAGLAILDHEMAQRQ